MEAAHTLRREVRLDPVTTGTYRPRRPQDSFLYQLVQQHLETLLAIHREAWQDAVNTTVRKHSPAAPRDAVFGAVAFLHRAGSFLNEHTHKHSEVTDGVFAASDDVQAALAVPALRAAAEDNRVHYRV